MDYMNKVADDAFREALIDWLTRTGVTATDLARRSGVSKAQIDKLVQRRQGSTNVEDALRISWCFGQDLEVFMGLSKAREGKDALLKRISRLTPTQLEMLEALIQGLLAAQKPQ